MLLRSRSGEPERLFILALEGKLLSAGQAKKFAFDMVSYNLVKLTMMSPGLAAKVIQFSLCIGEKSGALLEARTNLGINKH